MKSQDSLYDFYRDRKVVWVEDELTLFLLRSWWTSPRDPVVVTAASKDGVFAVVEGAPAHHASRIFGVVDRDFEQHNAAQLTTPTHRVFRLERHEIENYLLDFDVLAALSARRATADELKAAAKHKATKLIAWMACKHVLDALHADVIRGFPTDPPQSVETLAGATAHITRSAAWQDGAARWTSWTDPQRARLEVEHRDAEASYRDSLAKDLWTTLFSGKEIVRWLRSQEQFGLQFGKAGDSAAERELALGKHFARAAMNLGRVPAELLRLRDAIVAR